MAVFQIKTPASRQGAIQTVACTTSSTAGITFASETFAVMLTADTACHYKIGDGVQTAAATTSTFLPANTVVYHAVTPGQQIGAIRAATDGLVTATSGTLWVTELS